MLSETGVNYLLLTWTKRPTDDTFTLQMNDETNSLRNKYVGSLSYHRVTDLHRNTEYKFRVRTLSSTADRNGWAHVRRILVVGTQRGRTK